MTPCPCPDNDPDPEADFDGDPDDFGMCVECHCDLTNWKEAQDKLCDECLWRRRSP